MAFSGVRPKPAHGCGLLFSYPAGQKGQSTAFQSFSDSCLISQSMTQQSKPGHQLARDLLRLDDLDRARQVAEEAIEDAENPWPYRLVLLEFQRLKGQRQEALEELDR